MKGMSDNTGIPTGAINPEGEFTITEAAKLLGISYWKLLRLKKDNAITFTGHRGTWVTTGAEILRLREQGAKNPRGSRISQIEARLADIESRLDLIERTGLADGVFDKKGDGGMDNPFSE